MTARNEPPPTAPTSTAQPKTRSITAGVKHLELNAAEPLEKGCRLTFLVNNQLGADLATAAFELRPVRPQRRGRPPRRARVPRLARRQRPRSAVSISLPSIAAI